VLQVRSIGIAASPVREKRGPAPDVGQGRKSNKRCRRSPKSLSPGTPDAGMTTAAQ
jgi:hypothetical protein